MPSRLEGTRKEGPFFRWVASTQIAIGLPAQRLIRLRHQLASGRLNRGVFEGGKSRACGRGPAYHRATNRH